MKLTDFIHSFQHINCEEATTRETPLSLGLKVIIGIVYAFFACSNLCLWRKGNSGGLLQTDIEYIVSLEYIYNMFSCKMMGNYLGKTGGVISAFISSFHLNEFSEICKFTRVFK